MREGFPREKGSGKRGQPELRDYLFRKSASSDYIFADGKRIAKSDNFEDRIHAHATDCSNCGYQWYQFAFSNAGGLTGRVVQTGDKLIWRRWGGPRTPAPPAIGLSDVTQNQTPRGKYVADDADVLNI